MDPARPLTVISGTLWKEGLSMPAAMPSGRPQQHPLSHARLPLGAHLDPFPRSPPVLCDPSLCPLDDLVEKQPCSWNSSRVCECRAGTFCVTSATNSCARCSPHSVCPAGKIVKFQGKSPDPQPRTPTCAGAVPTARPPDDFSPLTFCFPWDRPPSSHDLALGAPAAPSSHLCLRLRETLLAQGMGLAGRGLWVGLRPSTKAF